VTQNIHEKTKCWQ